MKTTFLAAALLCSMAAPVAAQTAADPVIMTIAGKPVPRSEFEYSFNKNNADGVIDKKTVEEYVPLFVNYKMKVQAALDEHMDTLSSFLQEFRQYRDEQLRPSYVTDGDVEREARKVYEQEKSRLGGKDLVRPAHIFLQLRQDATQQAQDAARQRIDSIREALRQGADFAEMVKLSDDKRSAARGGELGWVGPGSLYKEMEDGIYPLSVGQVSEPVLSPAGWHIFKMLERKQLEPFEQLKDNIVKAIERQGVRDYIARQKIDSLVKATEGMTQAQLMDQRAEELSAQDDDMRYLIQEYHDGLLFYEISNREVWDKAQKDTVGLEQWFKKHRKQYKWDEPRFKGIAYHTREAADVEAVKQCVKKLPFKEWGERLRLTFNADTTQGIRIRVEKGIFRQGDNALVDSIVFKKDTLTKAVKNYPYDDVYGKKLKKPEEWTDVSGQVVSDLQEELERQWVARLRERYTYTVDKQVLGTVNKH
ncbi:MAG: peptidylprolyl isomerase [Prevotella sp.]|nr:peptidylprolyl isomerase [Prevotella sp.]